MNDYNVRYEGVFPSIDEQIAFENTLTHILDEAPSNSFLDATVTKNGALIKGHIQVNSMVGPFFGAAAGVDLEDLGQQLVLRMRDHFNIWKSQRFEISSETA